MVGVFDEVNKRIDSDIDTQALTVDTDKKIQFRDSGIYINSNADGKLTISSDGGGSDDITLDGGVTVTDGKNLTFGTSTGTQIGSSNSQKLAFYGTTPAAQQSSTGTTAGFTAGTGSAVNDDSTFTGDTGSTAYTIGDVVKHLKTLGLVGS